MEFSRTSKPIRIATPNIPFRWRCSFKGVGSVQYLVRHYIYNQHSTSMRLILLPGG
jgi:hypothetical protein